MNNNYNRNIERKNITEISAFSPKMDRPQETDINESELKVQENISRGKAIKSILFVDDEEQIRIVFKQVLEKFRYKVMIASNGNEAMRIFRIKPADLIITDIVMPEKDGLTFIHEVLEEFPGTKIIAITGNRQFGSEMELNIAATLGAKSVFTKPIKVSKLLEVIKALSDENQHSGSVVVDKNPGNVVAPARTSSDHLAASQT